MSEERTRLVVNFGLPELVQVPEELKHVGSTATRKSQRWAVVPEVLAESVPVTALLGLVAADG